MRAAGASLGRVVGARGLAIAACIVLGACGARTGLLVGGGAPEGDGGPSGADGGATQDASPGADATRTGTKPAVVVFGGYTSSTAALDDTWAWDGAGWTQLDVGGKSPGVRWGAWSAAVGGDLFVFGGSPATTAYLGDTWRFDGASWSEVATSGPGPRIYAAAGVLGGVALLAGGDGSAVPWSTDMWSLSGGAWKLLPVAVPDVLANNGGYGLPFQVGVALGGRFILFGGLGAVGALADTWAFDGSAWTKLAAKVPAARYGAAFATLGGDKVVLFGGSSDDDGFQPLNDTWIFDGAAWTQFGGVEPPARTDAAAAELNGQVVLFGGLDANGAALGDTWTFDGMGWTRQDVPAPPARGAAAVGVVLLPP